MAPNLITLIDGRTWCVRNRPFSDCRDGFHELSISAIMYRGISGASHLFTELLYINTLPNEEKDVDCYTKEEYERECGNCDRINPVTYDYQIDNKWKPYNPY